MNFLHETDTLIADSCHRYREVVIDNYLKINYLKFKIVFMMTTMGILLESYPTQKWKLLYDYRRMNSGGG
jgi:hypothetical protein